MKLQSRHYIFLGGTMNWIKVLFYFSAFGLIPILLSYSFSQEKLLPLLYGIKGEGGIKHILKAMSGLYLVNVLVFFLTATGIIPLSFGLFTLIVFMIGLAFGRLISFILDGERRPIFLVYFVLEVLIGGLAFWGLNFI